MASAKTYDQIAWTQFNGSVSTVTFSSIPASWTDLRLVLGNISAASETLKIRLNGDTGTNYSFRYINGNGTSATSNAVQSTDAIYGFNTFTVPSTKPATLVLDLMSYAGATYKTALLQMALDQNGSGATSAAVDMWRSTSAVTSITVLAQYGTAFVSGGTAALYGIKAA